MDGYSCGDPAGDTSRPLDQVPQGLPRAFHVDVHRHHNFKGEWRCATPQTGRAALRYPAPTVRSSSLIVVRVERRV